ncbi:hypothetical protein [Shimazuella kribbensis]|uniref:hypothetical protein n=1 Tax=Shimazuella kribbensis TaxID=139808 RepID=UPI00041ECC19|nr:hypothetical protein [Shimazuella kribbensis]
MKRITVVERKWWLSFHLLFVVGLLGHIMAFLVLSIATLINPNFTTLNASYIGMHFMEKSLVPISALGTVITGIYLSVRTKWGLFDFYWIIVKEILTVISIAIGILGIKFWTLKAITILADKGTQANADPVFVVNNEYLFIGILINFISLTAMVIISVFKPWGQQKKPLQPTR